MNGHIKWQEVVKKYPVGTVADGTIKDVWHSGFEVLLDDHGDQVRGVVWSAEIYWDRRVEDATKEFAIGDRVKVRVLRVEIANNTLLLSLKRAGHDPWTDHASQFDQGQLVRGKVARFTPEAVMLELDNCVSGLLPRDDIPWSENAERILAHEDWVEARVKELDPNRRAVVVSLSSRLEEVKEEVGRAFAAEFGTQTSAVDEGGIANHKKEIKRGKRASNGKQEKGRNTAPGPVLIVDDSRIDRFLVRAAMEEVGYEDIDEADNSLDGVRRALNREYGLILMDLKMPETDTDAGIRAASAIKAKKPKVPIVLVTGDHLSEAMQEQLTKLDFAGMLAKPLRHETVAAAVHRFKETGTMGWAENPEERLVAKVPDQISFIEGISRSFRIARPLDQVLCDILTNLVKNTNSDGAAIFGWHPLKCEVRLEANHGIRLEDYEKCRPDLYRSPVTDLIYQPDKPIFFNHIDAEAYGKFYYLRPILGHRKPDAFWPLQACIGELLEAGGEKAFTLFVFSKEAGHFQEAHRIVIRAAAAVAGAAIREKWVIEQIASEKRLTSLGGVVASAAHELKSRLSILEIVDILARDWHKVRNTPDLLEDTKLLKRIEDSLQELGGAKEAMTKTVEMLLGWVREGTEGLCDVRRCVEQAVRACVHESRKERVCIQQTLTPVPRIYGNPIELEQVFLNILLNGIQHMRHSPRQNGLIQVEMQYVPKDSYPIKVRFRDTGPGIHSSLILQAGANGEAIFQPFYTTKSKGTGMGLYLCRGLLGNIGGRINVEQTAIGLGTTFLVELPEKKHP